MYKVPNSCATIELPLRRTLVRSVRYSAATIYWILFTARQQFKPYT
jgi:hypothetical protein